MSQPDGKTSKYVDIFNILLGLLSPRDAPPLRILNSYKGCFTETGVAIAIVPENANAFDMAIDELMKFDSSIKTTYSISHFESEVFNLLAKLRQSNSLADALAVRDFFEALVSVRIKTHTVLRDIYGGSLNGSEPCVLGPYTIYKFSIHKGIIDAKLKLTPEALWLDNKPQYLIAVDVRARHNKKAVELADEMFEKFDRYLRYAIGPSKDFDVGVLNYKGLSRLQSYAISEDGAPSSGSSNFGPSQIPVFDDPYFMSAERGFNRLSSAAAKSQNTDIDQRLLVAIEWLAQSYVERSPSSAFIKAAIALEQLFVLEKNTVITPSISAHISETVAMLLGANAESRLEIVRKVRELYGTRSKIVHRGTAETDIRDTRRIWTLTREAIFKLMTASSLSHLNSIKELDDFLKLKKFGFESI